MEQELTQLFMGYENPPENIESSAKNLHIEDLVFLKKENIPWEKQ